MEQCQDLPKSITKRVKGDLWKLNVTSEQISPLLILHTCDIVVDKHQLPASISVNTDDSLILDDNYVRVGYQYAFDISSERDAEFYFDITDSKNLRFASEDGGGLTCRKFISYEDKNVAVIEVCDLNHPCLLKFRTSWTEMEVSREEIMQGVNLETTRMWTKGKAVTVVKYVLNVRIDKEIVFMMDFEESKNFKLTSGGLKLRSLAKKHSKTDVGYLQVINPDEPSSLKLNYKFSIKQPTLPLIGELCRRVLAPGVILVSRCVENSSKILLRYQLVCSKCYVINYIVECSECFNVALVDSDEPLISGVAQPWDCKDLITISVLEPSEPWSIKARLSWTESVPKYPVFDSKLVQAAESSSSDQSEHVALIELET